MSNKSLGNHGSAAILLQQMLREFGRDGLGGEFEEGEHPLIDEVRAFLKGTRYAVRSKKDRAWRIYVAGPMTGLPEFNFPAFNAAATELRTHGWQVENPADHGVTKGATWADYLAYDLTRLGTCGAIYLLPGWELSKGAVLEHHIAQALGLEVMFAPNAYKTESYVPLSQRLQLGYTALVEIMRSPASDKRSKELAAQASWALSDAINVWRIHGIKEVHS